MRLWVVGLVILDWRKVISLFMLFIFFDLLLVAHILRREFGHILSRYFHTGAGWGLDWS